MDKRLSALVTNGILKIKDRKSIEQFRYKVEKRDLEVTTKQMIERMVKKKKKTIIVK